MSSFLGGGGGGGGDGGAAQQQAEEARKDALRGRVNSLFQGPDAQPQFKSQEDALAQNYRDYYSSDLKRNYDAAARNLKFSAANSGNVGGSAYADQQSKLDEQNQLGGTRIEDAVRSAVNNLRNSREDARTRSISLINAGEGESGVQAASTGLQNSISAANSAQKQNLFGDLFGTLAASKQLGDAGNLSAQQLALYNRNLVPGSSFSTPTKYGTSVPGA